CLGNPKKPQYNEGIIVNPDLQNGLVTIRQYGNDKVNFTEFEDNKFVIVRWRNQPYDSVSQKVCLEKGLVCTFSGQGNVPVELLLNPNAGLCSKVVLLFTNLVLYFYFEVSSHTNIVVV
ncbi:LOW QUALITY PROTEIN: hypothetical protein HID58_011770, partial [Brassica napus]